MLLNPAGDAEGGTAVANDGKILGHLDSVSGAKISASIKADSSDNNEAPQRSSSANIGTLIKVSTRGSMVFGVINNLSTNHQSSTGYGERITFGIDLIGEMLNESDTFQRGVSFYPNLGADVLLATVNDVAAVYGQSNNNSTICIGSVHQDPDLPANLLTNELLGKHFAILGTTGSGKSCAVALTLRSILSQHPNGHVILLDPHNEYSPAFGNMAEVMTIADLQLPYWLLTFEESVEVMVSKEGAERMSQISILRNAILESKKAMAGENDISQITVDTPSPYRLSELKRAINSAMGNLDKPENSAPYLRLLTRLDRLITDKRFSFMFSSLVVRDTMTTLLSRVLRIPVEGKPITIIDLSGVPSEVVDVVVSLLCRMVFDFSLWSAKDTTVPVLLVCEEAHRYVPERDELGFNPTKRAISRIAKEGRKYGVSVCLVSQRPSELSATILSQCGTLIALRMGNERDQEFVARTLPETSRGLLDVLPTLRTREALVVGEGVSVPMRIRFDSLDAEHRPSSATKTFSFSGDWQSDKEGTPFVEETVQRWRRQKR